MQMRFMRKEILATPEKPPHTTATLSPFIYSRFPPSALTEKVLLGKTIRNSVNGIFLICSPRSHMRRFIM